MADETAALSTDADADVVVAAQGGGLNLVGSAFNQILRLGITLLLARTLGGGDVGRYFQAFAFLSLLDLICLGGTTFSLTRFVVVHRADGDAAALRGTVRLGLVAPTLAAVVAGVALGLAAGPLASGPFSDPRLAGALRLVAVALPFTVFTDAALAATRGFVTMRPYVAVNLVFEPLTRIVLTAAVVAAGWELRGAMGALVVTNVLAALLAGAWLLRMLGPPKARPRYLRRELFTFSAVSWIATLAGNGLLWADTILLGLYRPPQDIALYQVATRLTLLATLALTPISNAFGPQIADLYQGGHLERLRRIYAVVTSWSVRLSLPSFVVLFVFSRQLLLIFGRHFPEAATVTVVLAAGQLVNVATGPVAYMLVMSGRPRHVMTTSVAGLVLNLGLNLWLIPRHGVIGAAVAWGIALVVINVARVVQVWISLRMHPFDFGLVKGLGAGAASLAVALVVRWAVSGFPALLVGAPLVVLVYALVLRAAGITAEDRLVFDRFRRRVGLARA